MTFLLKHTKPYTTMYDVFLNGKKLKNRREYAIESASSIQLVERNPFAGRFWWVLAIFNFIIGLTGSFDDWKDQRSKQRMITVSLGNVVSDTLTVTVPARAAGVTIEGVDGFTVLSEEEQYSPKIAKRIKIAKKMLIVLPVCILLIIALALAITFLVR